MVVPVRVPFIAGRVPAALPALDSSSALGSEILAAVTEPVADEREIRESAPARDAGLDAPVPVAELLDAEGSDFELRPTEVFAGPESRDSPFADPFPVDGATST